MAKFDDLLTMVYLKLEEVYYQTRSSWRDLKFKLWLSKSKIKCRYTTSEDQIRHAQENLGLFSSEFIDYLHQITPYGINWIASPTQINIIIDLYRHAYNNTLVLTRNLELHDSTSRIIHRYEYHEKRSALNTLEEILVSKQIPDRVNISLGYEVFKDCPSHASISGISCGKESLFGLTFYFFPEKVKTVEQYLTYNEHTKLPQGIAMEVYEQGNRIVIQSVHRFDGMEHVSTDQLFYVGGFIGEKSKKKYEVYLSNEDENNSKTIRTKIQDGAFNLSHEK